MPKVSRELVRQREATAWALRCAGEDQATIAEKLGVTQPAVSQMLARVSKRVLKALEQDVSQAVSIHTARLERIFREAMHAWEESKKPKQKSRSHKVVVPATGADLAAMTEGQVLVGGVPGPVTLRETSTKEASKSDGDVAYLAEALRADAELRKLHGINAPKKIDLLDKRRPLEKLSDEELAERAREGLALLAAEGIGG
jgi:DNA-binding transcriptional regulator YdaS (Cro superfamily)